MKLKVKNWGRSYNYAFLVKPTEILLPSKQRQRVRARSLLCFWAVREFGLSATLLAQKLGMTQPSVSRAVQRGENLAIDETLIFDLNNINAYKHGRPQYALKTHNCMTVPDTPDIQYAELFA